MAVKKASSTTKAATEKKAAVKPAAEVKETAKPAVKAEKATAKAIETKTFSYVYKKKLHPCSGGTGMPRKFP